jgi:hypothetical protein
MVHTSHGIKIPLSDLFFWAFHKRAVFPLTPSRFTEMVKRTTAKFYPDD